MTDDLPFLTPEPDSTAIERPPRRCRRHDWVPSFLAPGGSVCSRCLIRKDPTRSRRAKNNGKRGRADELAVAKIIGGRKVGPLGLPWDVEIPGFLRVQAKKLAGWPSLSKVIEWLDAIPAGNELRAVSLADTPGPGKRTRRLVVMDLDEFTAWFGRTK